MTEDRRRDEHLRALHRSAPRDRFVRSSFAVLAIFGIAVWLYGPFALVDLPGSGALRVPGRALEDTFSARRLENLDRFLDSLAPRDPDGATDVIAWIGELVWTKGLSAVANTLAVAFAAASLAAILAFPLLALGARSLAAPEPFGVQGGRRPTRMARLVAGVRTGVIRITFLALRAVPEYLLAFVLVVLGPGAWPAVLALGLHNAGALGRLGSEVVENLPTRAAAAARASGATRAQIATLVLWPSALPGLLVYFFYRIESCIRESIVLGMLGVGTLGYLIQNDARARLRYDELLVYLGLGLVLVLAGDGVSTFVRRSLRQHAH